VVAVVLANVANVGLDLLLVLGGGWLPAWTGPLRAVPALGAAGAAIATTLVTGLQLAVLVAACAAIPAERVSRRLDPRDVGRALRVGVPVALHMGAEVGVFALVGFLAGRLGPAEIGAHQIAIACASISFTVAVGIGNAGGVRVGWAVGAGDREAARRAGFVAFGAGSAFMSCAALLFLVFPRFLAGLFTDAPEVLAIAAPLLGVAAVFQVSDGVQGVGAGVLRGAGDTRFTFGANMLGHWVVGLPLALALGIGAGMGVVGLWWGLALGLSAVAVGLFGRFVRISRGEMRRVEAA
jgi:MATE family multidrug resistance protein